MEALFSASLDFANREVVRTRENAKRALAHREAMADIPAARVLADYHCRITSGQFKSAIAKRAFEIRTLRK